MAFFDRFFRSKRTAPPPSSSHPLPPAGSPPLSPSASLPLRGAIESYDVADAVGTIRLPSGDALRFGRSACRGFEPVVGAQVLVQDVAAHPLGRRATSIDLDTDGARYDALLDARDDAAGLPSRALDEAEAVATARTLALVTVLLAESVPAGTLALRRWATDRGFPWDGQPLEAPTDANAAAHGIAVRCERELEFVVRGGSVLTYVGRSTLPRAGLDTRDVPAHFDFGRAFLGLGVGLPGVDRALRGVVGGARDVFAVDGPLRQLCRVVALLAPHATGVVLHRAGDYVVPIDAFVGMFGDLEDPACRPFTAWLDVGVTRRGGATVYATFGMDAFGLPDVVTPVEATDAFSRSRRHEAVLYAGYVMVRENRALSPGERLDVPIRTNVGPWPLTVRDGAATLTYSVEADGALLALVPEPEPDLSRAWDERRGALAVNAYQALFDRGLAELYPSTHLRDVSATNPDVFPHSVEVRSRADGRGFLIVTNGFGRAAQRHPEDPSFTHVELAAWVPTPSFELVELVGLLGSDLHASTTGAWRPGDRLACPFERLGIGGFLLADAGAVGMGRGPSVRLLLLVPVTRDEYEATRGRAAEWLAATTIDERCWARFEGRS